MVRSRVIGSGSPATASSLATERAGGEQLCQVPVSATVRSPGNSAGR
jgi:hypothetical protein